MPPTSMNGRPASWATGPAANMYDVSVKPTRALTPSSSTSFLVTDVIVGISLFPSSM